MIYNSLTNLSKADGQKYETIFIHEVDSTNEFAKRLNKPKNGTVIIADIQTSGKGRLGKSFFSPHGGLYSSLILTELKFDSKLITPIAAVFTSRAIKYVLKKNVLIKWVNDLYYNEKKICGILCESVFECAENPQITIVGIGINLFAESFPADIENKAGNLLNSLDGVDFDFCKVALTDFIRDSFLSLKNEDIPLIMDEYRSKSMILGSLVKVLADSPFFATAHQIDCDGALIVRKEDGSLHRLISGDVSIKKQK